MRQGFIPTPHLLFTLCLWLTPFRHLNIRVPHWECSTIAYLVEAPARYPMGRFVPTLGIAGHSYKWLGGSWCKICLDGVVDSKTLLRQNSQRLVPRRNDTAGIQLCEAPVPRPTQGMHTARLHCQCTGKSRPATIVIRSCRWDPFWPRTSSRSFAFRFAATSMRSFGQCYRLLRSVLNGATSGLNKFYVRSSLYDKMIQAL